MRVDLTESHRNVWKLAPLLSFEALIAGLATLYYTLLFTGMAHVSLINPYPYGLTFNNMLDHLLHGRFDVDPQVIGGEGFVHSGKTYAYFGIFPALLRLPLIVLPGWRTIDVTLLSCVLGTALAGYFKLRAIIAVRRRLAATRLRDTIFLALIAAVLFGGVQVEFDRTSIYVEVICWANAFAAIFVYCAIEGLLGGFSLSRLMVMAAVAGLTSLTRISTALGLAVAVVLLALWLAWSQAPDRGRWRALFSERVLAPGMVLAAFALACGAVNFERWGNPLTFARLSENIINRSQLPYRFTIINQYGEFNIIRIGYGLMYYFLPLWTIITPDHRFLFENFQKRVIGTVELPPSSVFLTDPLLVLLSAFFVWLVFLRRTPHDLDRWSCGLLLGGLTLPALIVLMFEGMTLRYRVEFSPVLTMAALLGFYSVCAADEWTPPRWLAGAVAASAAVGVITTHFILALYWLSPFGPADHLPGLLEHGWAAFYRSQIELRGHQLQMRSY